MHIKLITLLAEMKGKRKLSCGIVAFVKNPFRVLLAHPGGPKHMLSNKGGWTIPKGQLDKSENKWDCAKREFKEETNLDFPPNIQKKDAINLGNITQRNNKVVKAWAVEMTDDDISNFKSNTFKQWEGKHIVEYPEIDSIKYFEYDEFRVYLKREQIPLIDRLYQQLKGKKE